MTTLDNVFHSLHQHGLLVLANVADAGGARIVERLGGKAVATSSAAMAWSHGYQDGNQLPLDLLSTTVKSMARVLSVPLTVDIEAGYSNDQEQVGQVINAVSIAEFLHGAMDTWVRSFLDHGQLDTHALKTHTYAELNALMAAKTE